MAWFQARYKELMDHLDTVTGLDATSTVIMKNRVDQIKTIRNDLFARLISILSDRTLLLDKSAFDTTWITAVSNARLALTRVFDASGVRAFPEPFALYWKRVQWQEDKCLDYALLPEWRTELHRMVAFEAGMQKLIRELSDKWRRSLAEKEPLANQEKQAVDVMAALVRESIANLSSVKGDIAKALDKAATDAEAGKKNALIRIAEGVAKEKERSITSWLKDAADGAIGLLGKGMVGTNIENVRKIVVKGTEYAVDRARLYNQSVDSYRNLMLNHGFVLSMFKKNRDLVASYRFEQNIENINTAKSRCEEALSKYSAALSTNHFTSGISEDAKLFAKGMAIFAADFHKFCQTQENQFVSEFYGVFQNTTSDITIEALTDRKTFEAYIANSLGRVDIAESRKQLSEISGSIGKEYEKILDMLTRFEGLPEETKLIWLNQSEDFRRDMRNMFKDMLDRYMEDFRISQGKVEALFLEFPAKLDRRPLTAVIM